MTINAANLQSLAHQVITELELSPSRGDTARELIEKAGIKLEAIVPDALSPEAKRTHARLSTAVGVLRNAGAEASSEAFKAAIAAIDKKTTSTFIGEVNAAIARDLNLKPAFSVNGKYFPTMEAARTYAVGVATVEAFAQIRARVGEDNYLKIARGQAYLQHDPKDVDAARKSLLALAESHFGAAARTAMEELFAGGALRPEAEPLKAAAKRLLCTTADGKEYDNSYYAKNPPEHAFAIAADPALLAFTVPTEGISEPWPMHVNASGSPVWVNQKTGERAKELALAKLEKLLQGGPLDATYGPIFGEHLRDTLLALHGETAAKALEQKAWGGLFKGIQDEPITKYAQAYLAWAEADTLAKFDSLTIDSIRPSLGVSLILKQVEETTGTIAHFQYEPLRQNLLAIEAGAQVAHHLRKEATDFGIHKLGQWAREKREALEARQAQAEANAASNQFHDRTR